MPVSFEKSLSELKEGYVNNVNAKTSEIILATYPDYTQRNIIASGDSALIEKTWDWINAKRLIANNTKAAMQSATSSKIIYDAYADFEKQIQGTL
jgi:hypothetical protein